MESSIGSSSNLAEEFWLHGSDSQSYERHLAEMDRLAEDTWKVEDQATAFSLQARYT
jgi:hypothetical protein